MQSGKSIYDGWISDSDLIGTHYRYGKILSLSDYMEGSGKEWTNPGIDLKDFIGTSFTTAPDKKLYQLPDQQFANLYWFRADLFARQDLKDKFKAKYGYDLGVPLNWSAYEDIAAFFSEDVQDHRWQADLRPHGLRQEGSVPGLAFHRCMAVDGGDG
jgi:glycerol transport system substrate-binding protein